MDIDTNNTEMQPTDNGRGIIRSLRAVVVDRENRELLQEVWEKLRDKTEIFADQTRDNPYYFLAVLTQPGAEHFYYWPSERKKPSGIMSVMEILPGSSASFHASFWEDEPFSERLKVAEELIDHMFAEHNLNRLTVAIPDFHKTAIRSTRLLGFRYEGALRKAHLYGGRYYDVQLYGLLREEFDKRIDKQKVN